MRKRYYTFQHHQKQFFSVLSQVTNIQNNLLAMNTNFFSKFLKVEPKVENLMLKWLQLLQLLKKRLTTDSEKYIPVSMYCNLTMRSRIKKVMINNNFEPKLLTFVEQYSNHYLLLMIPCMFVKDYCSLSPSLHQKQTCGQVYFCFCLRYFIIHSILFLMELRLL